MTRFIVNDMRVTHYMCVKLTTSFNSVGMVYRVTKNTRLPPSLPGNFRGSNFMDFVV